MKHLPTEQTIEDFVGDSYVPLIHLALTSTCFGIPVCDMGDDDKLALIGLFIEQDQRNSKRVDEILDGPLFSGHGA